MKILYAGRADQWDEYRQNMERANAPLPIVNHVDDPDEISYILYAPNGPITDFTPYKNLKLVQSLWAGVEQIVTNDTLIKPLARMVDTGMSQGMADYVLGHVLRHHLHSDDYASSQDGTWNDTPPKLSTDSVVGFLGLGALGLYCAQKVADFGFQTCGWSRTQKHHDVIDCHSGTLGLHRVLSQSDILVLLMPNTPETENIINADTLFVMKNTASIINPGRGTLIDDAALLYALDKGKLASATLDVFRTEPLPADHPYWAHPNILVTPHIASATRISTACALAVENINNCEQGKEILHLVDRERGY